MENPLCRSGQAKSLEKPGTTRAQYQNYTSFIGSMVEAAGVEVASSIGVLPTSDGGLATNDADSVTLSGAVLRDIIMVLRAAAKSDTRAGELLSELEREGVVPRLPMLAGFGG